MLAALTTLAGRACRPGLILLDDLQDADTESVEWLHHVGRSARTTSMLVVGAYASGAQNPALERLASGLSQAPLRLGALDDASARALLADALEDGLSPIGEHALIRRARGVPLVLRELARMTRAEGLLWALDEGHAHEG